MSWPPQDVRTWLLAGGALLFVLVCILSLRDPQVVYFPTDSEMFKSVAVRGLGEVEFWAGVRPWGFPLLMKLCGLDNVRLATVQFGLHLASWLTLAAALFVAGKRTWFAIASALAVLAFACSPHLVSWSAVILSESLAHSMLALFLAILLFFRDALERVEGAPGVSVWALAAGLAVSGLLLSASRDNWPYLVLLVAVFLLFPLRRTPTTAVRVAVAALLVASCLLQMSSAKTGWRWREGMINVVMSRIVSNEDARERWRSNYGLPVDAEILRIADVFEPGHQQQINGHAPFQGWLREHAMGAYARDILTHPVGTTGQVLAGHRITRDEFSWEYSQHQGDGTFVARAVRAVLFRPLTLPVGADFVFPVLLLGWLAWAGPRTWRGTAVALLLVATYLPLLQALSYLSDSNEIYRHSLPVAIGLRLTGLLATIGAAGAVVELVRRPRT
jgi:hypothetical protein